MKKSFIFPLLMVVLLAGMVLSGHAQESHRFRCCHKKNVQDTAVQTDISYWQLVHPKTAKSGAIFRKGGMYVLDTNEWIFFTISDTTCFFVDSEVINKYGETTGKTQYVELPSGKTLLSFLSELEAEDDVDTIYLWLKKALARDKSPKLPFLLYRYGNRYYEEGYIGSYQSCFMELPVADNQVYVYYRNKSERELVKVPQNMSLEKYLDILEKSRNVDSIVLFDIGEDVEFDWIVQADLSEIPMHTQWGLERIYMQDAWDITMGDSTRTVAVLEPNGVDWSHYELGKGHDSYQNIYVNPGEDAWPDTTLPDGKKTYKPVGNGTDDDGNRLTDDFIGWNFRDGNRDCRTDSCAHGTGVAGIIAAKAGNGRGMKGIAGGNHCAGVKILPYAMGGGHLGASLQDAVRKKAKVANMSFSLGRLNDSLDNYNRHLQYAHDQNVILIAASGNKTNEQTSTAVQYPARNANVMAVGAVDRNNKRRNASCYGPELSVVAPGTEIYTTTMNDSYTVVSGTSSAAPHVSGVAALMLSANPGLSPAQLRRIIEKTARKVGGYTYRRDNLHPNGTWNEEMGYGLVDAHAAVLNAVDSTLDLYVRDASDDNGTEPSACTMPWNSPDIWIEDMDGNEVSHLAGNAVYNVCVRIHNRTDHASTGYEKLYLNWVKAGPSTDWSAAWTGEKKLHSGSESVQLGSPIILPNNRRGHAIPVIAAGSDTVVRVGWRTPMPEDYLSFFAGEELRHFCLCARIHDGNPIADEDADGINMGTFVRNSRKVAWKNISILEHPNFKMPMYVYSSRIQFRILSSKGEVYDSKTLIVR